MKALKIIDLVVIGLFVIGLLVGFTHTIQTEITPEEIVADVDPQYVSLIEP